MSWDAYLTCDCCGSTVIDQNFTHNCNGMAATAAEEAGVVFPPDTRPCWALPATPDGKLTHYPNGRGTISWWKHLDGMSGPEGGAYLAAIIKQLEADPARYRAMNPANGWGDYDNLLTVLTRMRDAVPECRSTWSVHG